MAVTSAAQDIMIMNDLNHSERKFIWSH